METLKPPPQTLVPLLRRTDRLASLPSLHLVRAQDGAPPRLRTSVRVGWRDGALLVRFDGRDDGRVATKTRRDDALWEEDVFEVFVSPQDPPHLYFEFEVNPLGTLFDARIESPQGRRESSLVHTEWDCPGFAASVTRRQSRWSASVRIPLDPVAPVAATPAWRANFYRIDRGRTDEFSAWSPTLVDPPDFHVPERFGVLRMHP